MSGLIKGAAAQSVRPFLDPPPPPPEPAGDPRLETLEREIDELRAMLTRQIKAKEEAVAAARAEGERQGKAAADAAVDKQVAVLAKAAETAAAAWQKRLSELDGLAAAIVRAALAKLFDEERHSSFVAGLVARQMRLLRRDSVVAIRVSPRDFGDEQALAALGAEAGTGSVRIVADAGLASGECGIDLQLGHIDIGAATQWAQLADLLDGLAAREGGG